MGTTKKEKSVLPEEIMLQIGAFGSAKTLHNYVQTDKEAYAVVNPLLQQQKKIQAQLEWKKLTQLPELPHYKDAVFPDEKSVTIMWSFAASTNGFSGKNIGIFELFQYAVQERYFALIDYWCKNASQNDIQFLSVPKNLLDPYDPEKINYLLELGLDMRYTNQAMEKSLQLLENYGTHPKEKIVAAGAVVLWVLNADSDLQNDHNLTRLMKVAPIITHPQIKKFEALFLKLQLMKICSYKIFFLDDQDKLIRTIIKALDEILIGKRGMADITWVKSKIMKESHAGASSQSVKLSKMLQRLEAQNIWIFQAAARDEKHKSSSTPAGDLVKQGDFKFGGLT